ncbi:MAG: aconitate hydratase AcnA, partial [Planctomycetes bacterium]|nr:aconitate hydratase AcnA [Planctomycetota bacterium]
LQLNIDLEYIRNRERYEFLRWGQQAFDNFSTIPPNTGIIHQVNLEYLATVTAHRVIDKQRFAFPDTLVGTDSHTTMINGLGVLGWGVGGIEAEAVMLGQPIYMLTPDVIGLRLTGALPAGATATDLVLTVTELLRRKGVVGKFVEFFGDGLTSLSLPDRATLANMAPEYGATVGFFPVDDETLRYLAGTGRSKDQIDLVERYNKEQGLFRVDGSPDPVFTDTVELDMSSVQPSLAGPKRPQDLVPLTDMKRSFNQALVAPVSERGFALSESDLNRKAVIKTNGRDSELRHGDVVIAAITSCTNTSNPSVLIAAALLAKKAVDKGLTVKPHVKTSLSPGSRVVTDYLDQAGLTPYLEKLGFHTVGYGCMTCIGNSGPLPEAITQAISQHELVVSSVLSGNRNFEGRISPHVRANYLASPPLVVAYALAGTTDIDLTREPLGRGSDGSDVYLKDLWPSKEEVSEVVSESITPAMFTRRYANISTDNEAWNRITSSAKEVYSWEEGSTYIQEPPFFVDLSPEPAPIGPINDARVLVLVGNSVTTDHISPAGAIPADGPAGQYLQQAGIKPQDFNSFGSRRGNDRVMTRGTFANIRLKNMLVPGTEGGVTIHLPSGEQTSIYDAAQRYKEEGTPLIVLTGHDYGMGSSRDWAAKGTLLLGIRAVIAQSFERIHRSNLVGMGVLPLQFLEHEGAESLGLSGHEVFDIQVDDSLQPRQTVHVTARDADGKTKSFQTLVRIDTPVEMDYYRHGGILHMVLRNMLGNQE